MATKSACFRKPLLWLRRIPDGADVLMNCAVILQWVHCDDGTEDAANNKVDRPLDRCILPNFDPWDRDIIPYVDLSYDPLRNCNRTFKPLTVLRNGILSTTIENITCWGRCLVRKSELVNKRGPWVKIDEADFRCDIVESLCRDLKGSDIYQMVHAQIIETETKEEVPVEENSFDVYVILLDSTAASQATRY
ncbi:hypothetical protein OSTOST_07463 [Ostertagia ostertagi]